MDTTPSKPRVTFEFEVEKVIGMSNDGRYQVKWAPAWVSKFHLVGCEQLIQEFLEQQEQQEQQQQQQQQHQQQLQQQQKQQQQAEENMKAEPEDKFERPNLSDQNSVERDPVPVKEVSCEVDNDQHGPSRLTEERDCLSTHHAELEDSVPKPIDSDYGTVEIKVEESESHFQLRYQLNDKNRSIAKPSAALPLSPTDQPSVSTSPTAYKTDQFFHENHSSDTIYGVPITENLGISQNNVQTSSEVELLDQYDATTSEETQRQHLDIDQTASLLVQPRARKKGFPCPYCEKEFTRNAKLSRHILIHTGEQPFSCEICGKSFRQKENVKQHMRIHTGEQPFSCGVCGKSFRQNNNLKQHMRTHTGEKPFLCEVCGKSYTCKRNLLTHMNTHTGDKPYACVSCGKVFHDSSHCARHMKHCSTVM